MIKLFCVVLLSSSISLANNCLPMRVEKDIPNELSGALYNRISPDGNLILAYVLSNHEASPNKTVLVDLSEDQIKINNTALGPESYPVEGDWRLIGSPAFGDTTTYYATEDLKKRNTLFTNSAFKGRQGGLYHVSGTLPGGTKDEFTLRTVSYGSLKFADYKVKFKDNKFVSSEEVSHKQKELCLNLSPDGKPQKIMQLMLSKDGTEIAGQTPSPTGYLQLFKVNPDLTCTQEQIPIRDTQKVMFSHPRPGKLGYIAFHGGGELSDTPIGSGKVAIYDRDLKKVIRASQPQDEIVSFSPGTLKDGRVAYFATKNKKTKLIIVDPYQIDPQPGIPCLKGSATQSSTSSKAPSSPTNQ